MNGFIHRLSRKWLPRWKVTRVPVGLVKLSEAWLTFRSVLAETKRGSSMAAKDRHIARDVGA